MAAPLIPILVDFISEEALAAAAETALIDAAGEAVIEGGGDLLMSTAADGEEVLAPIFEDPEVPLGPNDPLAPGDLGQVTQGQLHALWQDAKTFARWTGREIMKGALFQSAIDVIEEELKKKPSPGPDMTSLIQIIGSIAAALKAWNVVTTDWRQWAVKHFGQRYTFGMIQVEGTELSRFEIFRNHIAGLDTYLGKTLAPLLAKVGEGDGNIGECKAAMKTYGEMVKKLALEVQNVDLLMKHAGLKGHVEDVEKAQALVD